MVQGNADEINRVNRAGENLPLANPPRGTLVVMDDDPLFRRSIARVLKSEGYVVHELEEVQQLDKLLGREKIDLVIADSRLADGSDGWREAKRLAALHGDIKVLAVSGYDADAIGAVGGYVADRYLQKSGGGLRIVSAVEDALREA